MADSPDSQTSWEDPVVAEVRAAREALFASVGCNFEALAKLLREQQAKAGREAISLPPRSGEGGGEAA